MPEALTLAELRRELAEQFRTRPDLTDELRSALVWLCTIARPTRSRKILASKAGISVTTLWRHAHDAFPNGPSLHELLQFLTVIADLQAHFATATHSAKSSRALRERALKEFGVFPLDEPQAVLLAQEWTIKHLS